MRSSVVMNALTSKVGMRSRFDHIRTLKVPLLISCNSGIGEICHKQPSRCVLVRQKHDRISHRGPSAFAPQLSDSCVISVVLYRPPGCSKSGKIVRVQTACGPQIPRHMCVQKLFLPRTIFNRDPLSQFASLDPLSSTSLVRHLG